VAVRGELMHDLSLEDLKSALHNLCYEAVESAVPHQE